MASSSILSTADSCLLSLPNKSPFLHTALTTTKPLLHFRHNRTSNLSLSVKKTDNNSRRRRKLVPFVAETSEFWQEDEKTLTIEEGQGEGEGEGEEEEARWENDETGFEVEASGEGEGEGEVEEEGEFVVEDGDVEVNEDAKLFVGNLPYDVDSQQLAGLFQQAGVVEIAEVIYNRDSDQSRGFGFVTMSTVEEAEKAVEMFHRYDLQGRLLTVNKAAPRGQRPERPPRVFEPSYRIYVGNLPWDVDNAQLEQVFSEHGKVVNARVVKDRETGRSRGFGFVSMSSESEMNDAIAALDGQTMDGRAIRVNVAEQRSSRTF